MAGLVTRARSPAVVRAGLSAWLMFAAFGAHAQSDMSTPVLSVPPGPLFVEEGETTAITLSLSKPAPGNVDIAYRVKGGAGLAEDFDVPIRGIRYPAASPDDYTDETGGTVTIEAGDTEAIIRIRILQDDEIDATRELLGVFLPTPEPGAAYRLAPGRGSTAILAIKEGVCDRNEQIADAILDALPDRSDCADVDRKDMGDIATLDIRPLAGPLRLGDFWSLGSLDELDLSGRLTHHDLPPRVFAGLSSAEKLDLSGNTFTTLSPEVFLGRGFQESGLTGGLEELYLNDLPLAGLPDGFFSAFLERQPFVETLRTDLRGVHLPTGAGGEPLLPLDVGFVQTEEVSTTAVKLKLTVAQGAPYDITADLSVLRAVVSDNQLSILRGRVESEVFTFTQTTEQPGVVVATPRPPPATRNCRRPSATANHACYVGIAFSPARPGFRLGSGVPTLRIKLFLEGALE